MALFNWFGKKPVENEQTIPEVVEPIQEQNNEQGSPQENEEKKKIITITWGTGMPIDVIFNFIHKNFEEEGFQDALVNCDITYRDAKEKIIRNDLEMLFRRIILKYKGDIRIINVKIENAHKALALGAAADLEALRATYEEHLAEIQEMQTQLEADDPKMTTMIESYRRGFLKGIAANAVNFINNK
ncbi:MAG: hypothetical protein J6E29_02410 [Prevotella sp.]|jgi:hypothetical protein|nr:hypothetical protein [Prevotella sp.]